MTDLPAKLEQEGSELVVRIGALEVVSETSFQEMAEYARHCRRGEKAVDEVMDPIRESAHRTWKVAVERQKMLKAPFVAGREIADHRMGVYQAEQERRRKAAEEARRIEQERLEAEARKEALRLEEEARRAAEEATLAVAIQAEEQGDAAAAEQILEQPVFVAPVLPRPVFAPPVQVAVPQAQGVSFRSVWSAEVYDLRMLVRAVADGRVPLNAIAADMTVLNGVARSLKGNMAYPGVKAVEKRSVGVKA